jgi:DNA repair ATPase RecN
MIVSELRFSYEKLKNTIINLNKELENVRAKKDIFCIEARAYGVSVERLKEINSKIDELYPLDTNKQELSVNKEIEKRIKYAEDALNAYPNGERIRETTPKYINVDSADDLPYMGATRRLNNLPAIVKAKRGTYGIRKAAKEIGISPTTLSKVENGHIPDIKTLQSICDWAGYAITLTNKQE